MKSLLFIFIFALVLVGCDSPMNNRVENSSATFKTQALTFSSNGIRAEAQWLAGPYGNISQTNQLLVILKDAAGNPVSLEAPLTLGFYSTMPSMGHPMDDAGFFEAVSDGVYINKTIRFNMPGDWKHELWILDEQFNVKDKVEWDEFF